MTRARLAFLLGAAALAGCARFDAARDPQVTGMQINDTTMPEAASVQVPMPPPAPLRVPVRAEAASLWPNGSRGFFGDQRASKVGDILTVDIAIADSAKLSNESKRSQDGAQNVGVPTLFGHPKTKGDVLDLASSSSANGSGSINRNETIDLKVAAIVIQKLPNGDMVIAGRQEVKVNHELRELRVAGIIRPPDIRTDNTIPYEKIAEARITYGGAGQISSVQQPRYGNDFLNVVLPY